MDESQILSIIALIVSVCGSIIGVVNHRRIRSSCCGTKLEASFDIEKTSPVASSVSTV